MKILANLISKVGGLLVTHPKILPMGLAVVILVGGLSAIAVLTVTYHRHTTLERTVELLPGDHTIASSIPDGVGLNSQEFELRASGVETFVIATDTFVGYYFSSEGANYRYDIDLGHPGNRIGDLAITDNQLRNGGTVNVKLSTGDPRLGVGLPFVGFIMVLILAASVFPKQDKGGSNQHPKQTPVPSA